MTSTPIDRKMLQQLLEKYEKFEPILLQLTELERKIESVELIDHIDQDYDLKQLANHFRLIDEVMQTIGAVEIQIDQLEVRVSSFEKFLELI